MLHFPGVNTINQSLYVNIPTNFTNLTLKTWTRHAIKILFIFPLTRKCILRMSEIPKKPNIEQCLLLF